MYRVTTPNRIPNFSSRPALSTRIALIGVLLALAGVPGSTLAGEPPLCGNGLLEAGEECDDGNLAPGDGCDAGCSESVVSGIIATLAGGGTTGVAFDGAGRIVFSDYGKQQVFVINEDESTSPVAGNGMPGFSGDTGTATSARLHSPGAIAYDGTGNLFIADRGNYRVRKVSTDGIIMTVAGNGNPTDTGDGGPGPEASMLSIDALATDVDGNLFIADGTAHRVRRLTPSGTISNFAGTGVRGSSPDGGPAAAAQLDTPVGLAYGGGGKLFVLQANGVIRVVLPDGTISTLPVSSWISPWYAELGMVATASAWDGTSLVASASAGALATMIISIQSDGSFSTILDEVLSPRTAGALASDGAGTTIGANVTSRLLFPVNSEDDWEPIPGSTDDDTGIGGPAYRLTVESPVSLSMEPSGGLLVAGVVPLDSPNERGVRISADGLTEDLELTSVEWPILSDGAGGFFRTSVFSPSCTAASEMLEVEHYLAGGSVEVATLSGCTSYYMTLDDAGTLYLLSDSDTDRRVIWMDPGGASGEVTELAPWSVTEGFSSIEAGGIALYDGHLYVAKNDGIWKGTPLGGHTFSFSLYSSLISNRGLAFRSDGTLFAARFSDEVPDDNGIWEIDTAGTATRIVGGAERGWSGDHGPASLARIALSPFAGQSLAIDDRGRLLFADTTNGRIRRIYPRFAVETPAGTDVLVTQPDGDVTVTFENVATAGTTLFTHLPSPADTGRSGYLVAGVDLGLDISTTAARSGQIEICVKTYGVVDPAALRFLHEESGEFVDRTSSVDLLNGVVCGQVDHLSRMDPGVGLADCGNGALDPDEQCDDGNLDPCDECTPSCQIESPLVCGDGIVSRACGEECDNGGLGGGCSASCSINPACGNDVLDVGETCDGAAGAEACPYGCRSDCLCRSAAVCDKLTSKTVKKVLKFLGACNDSILRGSPDCETLPLPGCGSLQIPDVLELAYGGNDNSQSMAGPAVADAEASADLLKCQKNISKQVLKAFGKGTHACARGLQSRTDEAKLLKKLNAVCSIPAAIDPGTGMPLPDFGPPCGPLSDGVQVASLELASCLAARVDALVMSACR